MQSQTIKHSVAVVLWSTVVQKRFRNGINLADVMGNSTPTVFLQTMCFFLHTVYLQNLENTICILVTKHANEPEVYGNFHPMITYVLPL